MLWRSFSPFRSTFQVFPKILVVPGINQTFQIRRSIIEQMTRTDMSTFKTVFKDLQEKSMRRCRVKVL